ncbi:MAG TPA: pilus assembly protein TadG-related protein [Rhodoblastus sp.]|nr:pilus assembly protein TadG-related protein [Rhodoblastus sp.]
MSQSPSPLPFQRAVSRVRNFASDRRGSLSIAFALTGLAATMLVGASIDYSRSIGLQQKLQTAVDAAMLAAVQASAANRTTVATQVLNANLANSGITAAWTTTPTVQNDGSLTGSASGSIPTVFMSIARINSMNASASSTAEVPVPQTASSVTFSLTGAYGWWWKKVDLYIHTVGASSDTLLASYTYQPVTLSAQSGRGTGTTTATFLSGGSMVSGSVSTPVSMGSSYDNAYLKMTVYTDGCGPGMAGYTTSSGSTTTQNCVTSGTKVSGKTYTKSASATVYSTNDSATAQYLFVNGTQLASGATPTIFTLLPCNQTSTHAWEDGGGWSQQDIFFSVATTCAANSNYNIGARLKH